MRSTAATAGPAGSWGDLPPPRRLRSGVDMPPPLPRLNSLPPASPLLCHLWRLLHLHRASHGADEADGAAVHWRQGPSFSGSGCRQAGDQVPGRWQGRSQAPLPAWNGRPAGHPQNTAVRGAAHQQAPLPAPGARFFAQKHPNSPRFSASAVLALQEASEPTWWASSRTPNCAPSTASV